jgi:ribose transport system permease protein
VGGIFVSTVIFIGLLLLIWFFVKHTRKGSAIYAVGGSVDTARRLGINTNNTKLLVHAIAGVLAGLCGLFYVGYAVEIKPVVVPPYTIFPAFVAIAIAGISITGGRGNLLNILGGVILIAMDYSNQSAGCIQRQDTIRNLHPFLRGIGSLRRTIWI